VEYNRKFNDFYVKKAEIGKNWKKIKKALDKIGKIW
jgi:uncharacterized protein YeeX (DUF496 family)